MKIESAYRGRASRSRVHKLRVERDGSDADVAAAAQAAAEAERLEKEKARDARARRGADEPNRRGKPAAKGPPSPDKAQKLDKGAGKAADTKGATADKGVKATAKAVADKAADKGQQQKTAKPGVESAAVKSADAKGAAADKATKATEKAVADKAADKRPQTTAKPDVESAASVKSTGKAEARADGKSASASKDAPNKAKAKVRKNSGGGAASAPAARDAPAPSAAWDDEKVRAVIRVQSVARGRAVRNRLQVRQAAPAAAPSVAAAESGPSGRKAPKGGAGAAAKADGAPAAAKGKPARKSIGAKGTKGGKDTGGTEAPAPAPLTPSSQGKRSSQAGAHDTPDGAAIDTPLMAERVQGAPAVADGTAAVGGDAQQLEPSPSPARTPSTAQRSASPRKGVKGATAGNVKGATAGHPTKSSRDGKAGSVVRTTGTARARQSQNDKSRRQSPEKASTNRPSLQTTAEAGMAADRQHSTSPSRLKPQDRGWVTLAKRGELFVSKQIAR